jgi:para-nitrobenzyl esterase
MKKQFLSVLAFSAILLSSCGGTAKIEKASACGQEGEITASSATAIAETESGKVAGYVENGIYIYKGIPYAKAERFMPPVAADKWEGVRSSRAYGPTCLQGKRMGWYSDEQAFAFNWDDGYPDENCLRVNIWTPGLKDGKKRPVMVWLHGGGYSAGSGQELPSYDGTNLAKKGDAVVVTLNHRLNVLGFLDLSAYGDKYARANNAGRNPNWTSYEKLRAVIEKKMFSNTEDLLPVISFNTKTSADEMKKHENFVERMMEKGYTRKQVRLLSEWYLRVRKST